VNRTARSLLVIGALLTVAGVPLPASASHLRPVVSSHISFTGFDAKVRAGAHISVIQHCPAGSSLDKAATRAYSARTDAELQSTVRRVSRELWPTGMVSRYRILSAAKVPEADGFGLVNAAICTGQTSSRATSVSGRASTDVRVWGPASSGAQLFSVTLAAVTDRPPRPEGASGTDLPYRTALRAAGVAPSRGALSGGVRATQTVGDDDGSGTVMTTGTTLRTVPPGRFVSMRSSYVYTADLTRRITVTDEPETRGITIESRTGQGGSCTPQPQQVGAGEYQLTFVALDGPASLALRDPAGAVVLERAAVRQELPPGEGGESGGQPVWGVAGPVAVTLTDGDYTIECRPDSGPSRTAMLRVTSLEAARPE
jgi:hypothetical protein